MAFNYEEIIKEKESIIEDLIYYIYRVTSNEQDFRDALRGATSIDDNTIENYVYELYRS